MKEFITSQTGCYIWKKQRLKKAGLHRHTLITQDLGIKIHIDFDPYKKPDTEKKDLIHFENAEGSFTGYGEWKPAKENS